MIDYLEQFQRELDFSHLAQGTEYRYIQTVKRYLEYTRDKPEFTRDEIVGFVESLGPTSSTYKSWALRVLRRFYEALQKPWPLRRREGPRVEDRGQPYLTTEDVGMILELAKDSHRDYALFQVLIDTLCRRDEISKLSRENYHQGHLTIDLSKREGTRAVKLTTPAKQALEAYLKSRRDENPAMFVTHRGERLSPGAIGFIVKGYMTKAGIYRPGMGAHAFRRGGVRHLAMKKVPKMNIQTWGGWKTSAMVDRYAQLAPADVEEDIAAAKPLRS
jgi:integrase